mgnify:CR=1 FL=1
MRLRTEMVQEIDDNRFRRHLGERFFRSGSFFCGHGDPTWVPDWPLWTDFLTTFVTFWPTLGSHVIFLSSMVLGEAPKTDLVWWGSLPARILKGFCMVLCVALVLRALPFLFQLRPKFVPIPDQLLFYRLCLAPVALPFSCRGGGRAERVK